VALVGYPFLPWVAVEPRAVNNFRRIERADSAWGARVAFMLTALVWNRPVAGSAVLGAAGSTDGRPGN
jgi:hypothetical protein